MTQTMTLSTISDAMRGIDICMMTTQTSAGTLDSRPMSNNRQVDYNGDSYFFSHADMPVVKQIATDPRVNLSMVGSEEFYLSIRGTAEVIRDRARMKEHWVKDVEKWFEQGFETPGLVMIQVRALHLHYWNGREEGELSAKEFNPSRHAA